LDEWANQMIDRATKIIVHDGTEDSMFVAWQRYHQFLTTPINRYCSITRYYRANNKYWDYGLTAYDFTTKAEVRYEEPEPLDPFIIQVSPNIYVNVADWIRANIPHDLQHRIEWSYVKNLPVLKVQFRHEWLMKRLLAELKPSCPKPIEEAQLEPQNMKDFGNIDDLK